jgi:crotonobetainyl-CoA:carnitine CoA-transferase CaiB-like acyl-CoA transferase
MATKPLAGIKVLELARILAGPWCGQLLADLGADVVKVERAGGGDDTREWGPPFVEGVHGENMGAAYYHSCNRGKRGIDADFESEEGRALVRRLVAHADVVIENFKVGGLVKYGLDHASLKALNPGVVWCSISGFGQDGPYSARAGYDFLVQGMGGAMALTGPVEGPPMKTGVAIADLYTGLYAANAIQAALLQRMRTGEGAFIDCCLLDTQVSILGNQAINYFVSGNAPPRMGNGHTSIVPYDVYPTSDGSMIIACGNDAQFRRLTRVLGAPALADDPDYRLNRDRLRNRVALTETLNELTRRFTRAEILPLLEEVGVPAGPINTIPEVFTDPQVVARRVYVDVPNAAARGGSIPGLRAPILINGEPAAATLSAPGIGEHRAEILSDPNWGG